MGGLSISNQIGSKKPESSYQFKDESAENYYSYVKSVNGSDIDTVSIYGKTLNETKEAIDNRFIALKSSGIWSKLVHDFLFFGGTSDTHSICAVDLAQELTFFGSPTHSNLGMVTSGAAQFASMNNNLLSEVPSEGDWAIGVSMNSSNSKITMGSRDTSAVGAAIRYRASSLGGYARSGSVPITTPVSITDHSLVLTVNGEPEARLYLDGSEIGNSVVAGLIPSTYATLIAAWSNSGSAIDPCAGNSKHAFVASGLSASEVSNLNTINGDFQSFLGR